MMPLIYSKSVYRQPQSQQHSAQINIWSTMKGIAFVIFAVALIAIRHVDGIYSHKCKEAETSPDKLIRFIENANCTLIEGNKRAREKLDNIHSKLKQGFDNLKNKFSPKTQTNPGYEGLDHQIDVRILADDDVQSITARSKRGLSDEDIGEDAGGETQVFNHKAGDTY